MGAKQQAIDSSRDIRGTQSPLFEGVLTGLRDGVAGHSGVRARVEVGLHLGPEAAGLAALVLPPWCWKRGKRRYIECANALLEEPAQTRDEHIALLRRKAQRVDLLGSHLDVLGSPRAKAYMSCRAVLAAKADFDATNDGYNSDRGEAKRRAEGFFDIEASVGMQ